MDWTHSFSIFILHKSIFLHFVYHGTKFYQKCIKCNYKKKYIYDDGSSIFQKQEVRKIYNAKYQATYCNQNYVLDRNYIKDTIMRSVHSDRKLIAIYFVYIKCSPYRDAEGPLYLISCLHDAIINDVSRIG